MSSDRKNLLPQILQMLGVEYPDDRSSFYIACPSCTNGDTGRVRKTLNLNLEKDVFRCPKCSAGGGAVKFYAFMAKGIDPGAFASDDTLYKSVCSELFGKINNDQKAGIVYSTYEPKASIDFPPTDIIDRDETYNAMLKMLPLSDIHYNNLIERGLRKEDIERNGYATIPQLKLDSIPYELRTEHFCNLQGVPGFFKNHSNNWTMTKQISGFYIPMRGLSSSFAQDSIGPIQGLQTRFDNPGDGPRYMWFSSRDMKSGCGAMTWPHFVGYPEKVVYLTEGGLKGDIAHRFTGDPYVCIPGVNALKQLEPMLVELKKYGVLKIKTAFDMDLLTNEHVRKAYDNLVALIHKHGFECEMMTWDPEYKGIDDYLLHCYLKNGGKLDEKRP